MTQPDLKTAQDESKKTTFLVRTLSGVIYLLVIFGFYSLKVLLPYPIASSTLLVGDLLFDLLVFFMSVIGSVEMTRAVGERIKKHHKVFVLITATVLVLAAMTLCALDSDNFRALTRAGVIVFGGAVFFALMFFVFDYETTTPESIGTILLCLAYPSFLLYVLMLLNHLPINSAIGILLVFVVSPAADTFAYLFGMTLGRFFPKKAFPDISPKKTVVGCVGGVVGGIVGAVALFFFYHLFTDGVFETINIAIYAFIGAFASLATEMGDLIESAIKRKLGIKDMGRIMPGHGGILDRIDGTMYAAAVIFFLLVIVYWLGITL